MEYLNEQSLRELLERYFEGETTLAEEHAIGDYLSANEVPTDLAYAKAIFARNRAAAATLCDASFAAPRRAVRRSLLVSLAGVAAAAVIGVGVWVGISHERAAAYCYINGIAVNNIDQARVQTRAAFDKVDRSFSKAASSMSAVERANRSAEKVEMAVAMMTIK